MLFAFHAHTNFNKIHFALTLLAAFSHTFSKTHASRISFNFFFHLLDTSLA